VLIVLRIWLLGTCVGLAVGLTAPAADSASASGLELKEDGSPVDRGAQPWVKIDLSRGGCLLFVHARLERTNAEVDEAQLFTSIPRSGDCTGAGYSLENSKLPKSALTLSDTGTGTLSRAKFRLRHGECSYSYSSLVGVFSVPGELVIRGETTGTLVARLSSPGCAAEETAPFELAVLAHAGEHPINSAPPLTDELGS
jgi:hypothetical protein